MKSVVAIRTNRWTVEEQNLHARLSTIVGQDVHVVFHDRPAQTQPDAHVVDIDTPWVEAQGLRAVYDWGWRCGDYFYYALRQAVPDADFYWLIEPDVYFTSDPHSFFAICDADRSDALGFKIAPFKKSIRFTRGLRDMEHYRAIFALTRLSGCAIDRLLEARKAYGQLGVMERAYTNDEIFVFSHLAAMEDMTLGNLDALAPDWFEGVQFATNPDILDSIICANYPAPEKVWHPVRSVDYFKSSVAQRLATSTNFVPRMASSLNVFSDEDIEDIIEQTAYLLRENLKNLLK